MVNDLISAHTICDFIC